jgi:hypothetical protein
MGALCLQGIVFFFDAPSLPTARLAVLVDDFIRLRARQKTRKHESAKP